ncbi:MAG TPA: fatty acid desaturase [Gammaproteobacteria bacterium]|nr:fatty acid desaturase [Gammaproteobacteria bacterium]
MNILTHGLLGLPVWGYILVAAGMIHLTVVSVTLYLHRTATHRGLDMHPLASHVMRAWLWVTTGMLTKEWVAVHRKHHALCETAEDPHSPKIKGLRKVVLEGAELYRAEAANPETLEKYGRGTPDDWVEQRIYTRHGKMGVAIMLIIDLALFGVIGLTIWAIQMIAIPFLAAGVVNGLGHYYGYRNFECKDAATNVVPWGIILGGEELHNNHHAFPSSAKFALRAWEFDIGWWYIRALKWLGLVRVRRVAPTPVMNQQAQVNLDTVQAVILNRLHVLRHYGRKVIVPAYKQEKRGACAWRHKLLAGTRRLMIRDRGLLKPTEQRHLRLALARSQALDTVYGFRLKLEKLWENKAQSNDTLLRHFQEWCHEAEQSGVASLQEFAAQLRSYSLRPATA